VLCSAFSFVKALTGEKLLVWQNICSDQNFGYKKSFELCVSTFSLRNSNSGFVERLEMKD